MFAEEGQPHHRAHFHAYYQDHAAVFAVDTVECLGGSVPKAQRRLVEAWAEILAFIGAHRSTPTQAAS